LAEELKAIPDLELELIPGSGGVFDVNVEGDLLFSKHNTGRFPNLGEVTEKIESRTE